MGLDPWPDPADGLAELEAERRQAMLGARAFRAHLPRFSGDDLAANARLVEGLRAEAARHGVAPTTLAVAWALARDPDIVPVVGARTRRQIADALAGVDLAGPLDAGALAALEAAVPAGVAGTRYQPQQMQALDSER